jgi:predicted nucleic acid-binding protein
MPKARSYCWDTTVYVAWLGEEESAPLADIAAVIEEIEQKKAKLLVPVTAYMEVLEAAHSADEMAKFYQFLKRTNVVTIDVSLQIANKVQQIRSACLKCRPKRSIRTPDAEFVAAAILYKADVLHTLDDQLIKLSGSPMVDGLKIEKPKPFSGQTVLF